MCGIFGCVGFRDVGPLMLEGLKKLEYRGYDSCGVCSVDSKLHIKKDVGKIDEVEKKVGLSQIGGTISAAHTRWATTGAVTRENAHPHTDCSESIAVVHNGIIENYQELKRRLQQNGHVFKSQTDTEVIPHLIEEQQGPLEKRVQETVKQLKGSFAFLTLSTKDPEKMVAVRKESPLVIGLNNNGFFAASDVMPFITHTRQAIFLEDDEMAVLTRQGVSFSNARTGKALQKHVHNIVWDAEQASKGDYAHFMLKEILEQPAALKTALMQDQQKLEVFACMIAEAASIKLVACGTSRHAAQVGKYLFNRLAGRSCEVYIASEFAYFADQCGPETLVLCVSQSGETADVLVGLRKAKAKGAKVASIVNVVGSSIDRESDVSLYLNCGPEIAVASTKAFLAQLAVFYLLAYSLAGKQREGVETLKKVSEQLQLYLEKWQRQTKILADELKNKNHLYYLARGVNFPVALEGALKMKEISYIHAEGMPAGELKHGTLALIEKGTPVMLVHPRDYTFADTLGNGLETKARGAKLIGVSDVNNEAYDKWIELPEVPELFYPLVSVLPLQLLAYYAAVARGNDPDKPRNLAKSVTVR